MYIHALYTHTDFIGKYHSQLFLTVHCYLFLLQGEEYILPYSVETLITKKKQLISARKATGSLIGWDIPSSGIKFSTVLGKGQFGDVFLGQMEGQLVTVKVLRPDCGQEAKNTFDRELDILR